MISNYDISLILLLSTQLCLMRGLSHRRTKSPENTKESSENLLDAVPMVVITWQTISSILFQIICQIWSRHPSLLSVLCLRQPPAFGELDTAVLQSVQTSWNVSAPGSSTVLRTDCFYLCFSVCQEFTQGQLHGHDTQIMMGVLVSKGSHHTSAFPWVVGTTIPSDIFHFSNVFSKSGQGQVPLLLVEMLSQATKKQSLHCSNCCSLCPCHWVKVKMHSVTMVGDEIVVGTGRGWKLKTTNQKRPKIKSLLSINQSIHPINTTKRVISLISGFRD